MKYYKHHPSLLVFTLFILSGLLSLYACGSSKPKPTNITILPEATLSPQAPTTIPVFTFTSEPNDLSLPPHITQEKISEVSTIPAAQTNNSPVITDETTPIETSTPTATFVPPLVVTPQIPQFPMMGIEIVRYQDIEMAAGTGAYWIRRNGLLWSVVEPVEGAREWSSVASLEKELETISTLGMQTILVVRGTPAWAQKYMGAHCGPVSEDNISAFADFIHDAVVRYSQPPYNVKYWEIWNEPDVDPALIPSDSPFGCWGNPSDAYYGGGYYANVLKVVYPAIKSANPDAQVMVGGLLLLCDPDNPPMVKGQPGVTVDCNPAKFFEGVLRNGGGDYFDGVSFHAYDYYFDALGKYGNGSWHSSWKTTGPVLIAKSIYLKGLLERYGYTNKFLMNTELAVLCGSSGEEASCMQETWEYTKVYHLVESYAAAATVGLRANIWFCLVGWRGSALVDVYGQPVPAYNALSFNNTMLKGATPWGEVTLYKGVKGFAFQREDKLIWVLWSLDGQERDIPLGTLPSAIYNVFGDKLSLDTNITITLSPIYIEW